MRNRAIVPFVSALALVVVTAGGSRAQVMRDFPPLELNYDLFHGDPAKKVGSATVSFKPIDTRRGKRLEVKSKIEYTVEREKPKGQPPFSYEEEATLVCDAAGVSRFDTTARALGDERVNSAVRMGDDYQVVTTFRGKKHTKTITAGVQRSNFALFAGGYLPEKLDAGDMIQDYPMLFPVGGDHQPRQKFREGIYPLAISPERQVQAIVSRLDRLDKSTDRIWNMAGGAQILLRMEESTNFGKITYVLASVNGVPATQSTVLK